MFTKFFIVIILLVLCHTDAVCDKQQLIRDLMDDLADNGYLDCVRKIEKPDKETEEEYNKRKAAEWNSSCSFETTYDWATDLKLNYGLTELKNQFSGEISNDPNQADMCEIVRYAIQGGLLDPNNKDISKIDPQIFERINCIGDDDDNQICAVNGLSAFKKELWTIFLFSSNIKINGKPEFNYQAKVESSTVRLDEAYSINRVKNSALKQIPNAVENSVSKQMAQEYDLINMKESNPTLQKNDYLANSFLNSIFKKQPFELSGMWSKFNCLNLAIKLPKLTYVIAFSMISGENDNSRLAIRMLVNNQPQISSRAIHGYMRFPQVTTAFVTKLAPGDHIIDTEYRMSTDLAIDPLKSDTQNLQSGIILIPDTNLFFKKVINSDMVRLLSGNKWYDFPGIEVRTSFETTSLVLVLYNYSSPAINSHVITRITVNDEPIGVYN